MNIGYLPWNQPATVDARPCLQDRRAQLTYAEITERVEAFAEQLAEQGVGRGDVVAVMLPNRIELLVAVLAAWRLRAVATPINPAFTETQALYQIQDFGAVLVLNSGEPAAGRRVLHVDEMRTVAGGTLRPARNDADDLALLIYTSGSTGRPKGVLLDHANLQAMSSMHAIHLRLTHRDHCLLVLPLFQAKAICVSFLAPILCGAQVTILDGFTPNAFLGAVQQYRPTYFAAVPNMYAGLAELPDDVRPDTSSLRFALCSAAPVSWELLYLCESRFAFIIVEGYGLTEGTWASTCSPIDGRRKLGSVGPALRGQRVATMCVHGQVLPAGEVGEVVVSGPNVMRGYLNRPEETARALVDGWLRTGDLGRVDDDGYLTLLGRT